VNAPPTMGPRTVPMPQTRPVKPTYMGRSWMLVVTESSVMTPTYMPLPPTPAMARPTMRAFMVGAEPQSAEPTSKMSTLIIYVHFDSIWPKIFPHTKFVEAEPIRKAPVSHGSFWIALKSAMMAGWILATIVLSRAKRKMELRMATTTIAHFQPVTVRGGAVSTASAASIFSSVTVSFPDTDVVSETSRSAFFSTSR